MKKLKTHVLKSSPSTFFYWIPVASSSVMFGEVFFILFQANLDTQIHYLSILRVWIFREVCRQSMHKTMNNHFPFVCHALLRGINLLVLQHFSQFKSIIVQFLSESIFNHSIASLRFICYCFYSKNHTRVEFCHSNQNICAIRIVPGEFG